MMHTLRWAAAAARCYDSLTSAQKSCIDEALIEVAREPRNGKPLHGPLRGLHSVHVRGALRIIYQIGPDPWIVNLLVVAHRRESYR